MKILITLPEYKPEKGFNFEWENNYEITIDKNGAGIRLLANKEGLISLAKQFLHLAQDNFPQGYHLHYDEYNSLSEGSSEFIVEKA